MKRKQYVQRTAKLTKWHTDFEIEGLYLPSGSNEDGSGDFVISKIFVLTPGEGRYQSSPRGLGAVAWETLGQAAFAQLEAGD